MVSNKIDNKTHTKIARAYDLCSTSHHEAGHCIIACLRMCKVESVEIFVSETNRIDGLTSYEFPDLDKIQDPMVFNETAHNLVSISYAGLATEKYLFKIMSGSDNFPMALRDGSSDDTLEASRLITKYNLVPSGPARTLYKKKMIKNILKELQDHWQDIILIAHALFKRKKLPFEEIKKILTKKSKNKVFWQLQFKNISMVYDNNDVNEHTLKAIL